MKAVMPQELPRREESLADGQANREGPGSNTNPHLMGGGQNRPPFGESAIALGTRREYCPESKLQISGTQPPLAEVQITVSGRKSKAEIWDVLGKRAQHGTPAQVIPNKQESSMKRKRS